jgi:hypothetical protein
MVKSRRMGWIGHVAYMGDMRNSYRILVEKPEVVPGQVTSMAEAWGSGFWHLIEDSRS